MRVTQRIRLVIAAALMLTTVAQGSAQSPSSPEPRATLSAFRGLPVDATFADVLRVAGLPAADVGSGIYVFVYYLPDGSKVLVGTPDRKELFYITHDAGMVRTPLWQPDK